MDQRKLIQHGPSSLTLALPRKWLTERGLKKGNSLYVEPEGNRLIVSTEESINIGKISVNVTGLDRTSILLYVQSLYRFGYNEIEIIFDKPTTIHYRTGKKVAVSSIIHYIVSRCIGAEIVQQIKNKITIKYITKEKEEDFKIILRRIFLLLKDASATLIDGIKEHDLTLIETIEDKHDNINNFVSYALRLLNKYGYPDVKKTCLYFHIIASIDKIVDVLKYAARDISQYKKRFNKETIAVFKHIQKSIDLYYTLFYKFDLATVDQLSNNRNFVKFEINKHIKKIPNEELVYLNNQKQILEILLDLTDFRMGLEY
ncbi:hypothetical protein COV16_01690 [Candidatus Woesearchaeota archaeon CG10_big_fil_rev_8_21_14_0_10_34_8]|nr:MAG: hypothetical protein COV16_01690 [Candidatus Woesearchaeota archaeon CG10_big_fil_rev_8_21_14_0_10_34_8]